MTRSHLNTTSIAINEARESVGVTGQSSIDGNFSSTSLASDFGSKSDKSDEVE